MNILIELFIVFFKLGAFTIGGGIAMLPLLQNTLINEKKWFTKEEFMDIVAVCQSLPGVVAINMATYVGYKKKGLIGSVVSTFGVTIPSFTMILIIARFITSLGDNGVLMGAMAGLRAAALGMVVVALIQLMPAAIKNKWAMLAAVVAFVLIAVLKVNTAYVILLFAMLGITVTFAGSRKMAAAAEGSGGAENVDALAEGNAAGGKTGGGKDGAQTKGAVSDGGAENAEAGEGGESE